MILADQLTVKIIRRFGLLVYQSYFRGIYVTEALSEAGAVNQSLGILNRELYRRRPIQQVKVDLIESTKKSKYVPYTTAQLKQLKEA